MNSIEETIYNGVQVLRLGVEAVGAAIICAGVLVAVFKIARDLFSVQPFGFNQIRLLLARYLALA